MSRLTVIPSRVLIVISTIVVALVLLLASSVQATGELLEITEVQTAEYKVRSGDNFGTSLQITPRTAATSGRRSSRSSV